jgi:hypothetical protein
MAKVGFSPVFGQASVPGYNPLVKQSAQAQSCILWRKNKPAESPLRTKSEGVGGENSSISPPNPPQGGQRLLIANSSYLYHFLLVLLCGLIALVATSPMATAQSHNGEIIDNLIKDFSSENQLSKIKSDPHIKIGSPDISYNKLKNKQFTRSIEVSVEIKDSVRRSEVLAYSDTLSLRQLKQIQKASPKDLRAELPTTYARTLRPLAIVTASIAGVISLFYIRSR